MAASGAGARDNYHVAITEARIGCRYVALNNTIMMWPVRSVIGAELFQERNGSAHKVPRTTVTVIVPAFDEAEHIAATIESLLVQSLRPDEIIVVDDCSNDETSDIASAYPVRLIRPSANTGSKAGAQQFALDFVDTDYVVAIDADTVLASDALEKLIGTALEHDSAAACGYVLPRLINTSWERGRYAEYLFALGFFKRIQDAYRRPLISSGCFSAYRTSTLKALGGWSAETMAEDMDVTWRLYAAGERVIFVPQAVCYPVEPHNFHFMRKQLLRWSHGYIQNVRRHRSTILRDSWLGMFVTVSLWDTLLAIVAYLFVFPVLSILWSPWVLSGYVIDLPLIAAPVLIEANARGETRTALAALPSMAMLRVVNAAMFFEALIKEFVLGMTLTRYEKGH